MSDSDTETAATELPLSPDTDETVALPETENPTDLNLLDTPALVSRLHEEDGWPLPVVLRAILARKEAAIEPLIDFLQRTDASDPTAYYAVELLTNLNATSALPAIAQYYRSSDEDMSESMEIALPAFGPALFPHFLPLVGDRTLTWYQRAMAIEILEKVSASEPALQKQLIDTLHATLEGYVADADTVQDWSPEVRGDFYDVVSTLISDLADLGAKESRPLIRAAFDAHVVNETIVDRDVLEEPFDVSTREHVPSDWLAWYEEQYEHRNDPRPTYTPPPSQPRLSWPTDDMPPQPYIAPPKPGRNDPCWCGSGKKYKKCHLGQPDDRFKGA